MKAGSQNRLKALPESFTLGRGGLLQRKCACGGTAGQKGECESCDKPKFSLQRSTMNSERGTQSSGSIPPIVHEVLGSSGEPLDKQTRTFMEPRFGHDFSQVRVHADARAAESARAVNALAYTNGAEIVFGANQYAPATTEGRKLLAHELAHVVQQSSAPQAGASNPVSTPNDPSEAQAELASNAIIQGGEVPRQAGTQLASVQRLSDEDLGAKSESSRPAGPGLNITDAAWVTFRENVNIDPRDVNVLTAIFDVVVSTNVLAAASVDIPSDWASAIESYAASNLEDAAMLLGALFRVPSVYRGGWILDLVPRADAMTLNYSIFARGPFSLVTYVHELTHVAQYGLQGVTSFLTTYFGISAVELAYAWYNGTPLDPMRSNLHESQAYDLGNRFAAWHLATLKKDAHSITI
jgi:hypothetical protein